MISDHAICLMYHSLYDGEDEYLELHPDDRPYSLSTRQFRQQLQLLAERNIPVLDARGVEQAPHQVLRQQHAVVLTFDDGHRSFHRHALPILAEYGHTSFMFLSTDRISVDPAFLDWREVRELHQAGHVIGGHGASHRFLDELDREEVKRELQNSRERIESCIQEPCTTMSFPGGRYNPAVVKLAKDLGYKSLFTSEIRAPLFRRSPLLIGRHAIRHNMKLAEFCAMVTGDRRYAFRKRGLQLAKKSLQKLLGNERYHRLYQRLAARR
ncbi:polysaccharide deacetylase family protein [Thiolapillus sp.]